MATVLPARSSLPHLYFAVACIARKTPRAVCGEGSPERPCKPPTYVVSFSTYSISAGLVPTSSAVMYLPARVFTIRPCARKSCSRSAALPSRRMIDLPPPTCNRPHSSRVYVFARQGIHLSAMRAAELLAIGSLAIAQDDRLAATDLQS